MKWKRQVYGPAIEPLSRGAGLGAARPAPPGPACDPRAAGASGKLLFLPRDLRFCTSRPTRAKPSQCSPPTAPSSALRATRSPGGAVTAGQRLRAQAAPGAAGGAQHRLGNYLCLSAQGRHRPLGSACTATPRLLAHATPCSQPENKAGRAGYEPWARWLPN